MFLLYIRVQMSINLFYFICWSYSYGKALSFKMCYTSLPYLHSSFRISPQMHFLVTRPDNMSHRVCRTGRTQRETHRTHTEREMSWLWNTQDKRVRRHMTNFFNAWTPIKVKLWWWASNSWIKTDLTTKIDLTTKTQELKTSGESFSRTSCPIVMSNRFQKHPFSPMKYHKG